MHYKDVLFFPVKVFSTVFGLGTLPVWNRVWPKVLSFFALFFGMYVAEEFYGVSSFDAKFVSLFALISALSLLTVGCISGRIYLNQYKEGSAVVSDAMSSQFFVLAFATPAIVNIGNGSIFYMQKLCDKFLYCPNWFYSIVTFLVMSIAPFASCRFFDSMEFWPSAYLNIRYHDSIISKHLASLASCFYSIILLYIIAFLVFKLDIALVIHFYESVLRDFYAFSSLLFEFIIVIADKLNFMKFFID